LFSLEACVFWISESDWSFDESSFPPPALLESVDFSLDASALSDDPS
jgi:hypothetical protein